MWLLAVAFMIIVFAALVSSLAASSGRTPTVTTAGRTVLRVNRGYLIVVGVGTALVVLLPILALLRRVKPAVPPAMVVGIVVGCLAICLLVVLATARLRVEFDGELIRHHGTFGRVKEIRWAEIREVQFSKARLELSLLTDSTRISLNMHMIGFPKFLETLKDRLDPALTRGAVLTIESLKRKL